MKEKFSKSLYCEVCGKQFSYKNQLKKHVLEDHGKQDKFPCQSCNQMFKSCDQLVGHCCKSVTKMQEEATNKEKTNNETRELFLHLDNEHIALSSDNV